MSRIAALLVSILFASCVAACSKPTPAPTEQKPEPQALAHTELRDAIRRPLDKAKAAQATVEATADKEQAAIDAAQN